jgi:hypothetical protein
MKGAVWPRGFLEGKGAAISDAPAMAEKPFALEESERERT